MVLLLGSRSANAAELDLVAATSFDSLPLLVLLVSRLAASRRGNGVGRGGTTHTRRLRLALDCLKIKQVD